MKYFSYGMNTNLKEMSMRCPTAVSLGQAILPMFEFNFKNYATVDFNIDKETHGVLWEITSEDELALDLLEGYPVYYTKRIVTVEHNGVDVLAMTYIMNSDELAPPSDGYMWMLEEGYTEHGISLDQIDQAFDRASANLMYNLTPAVLN